MSKDKHDMRIGHRRGFTIAEVMISAFIFTVVISSCFIVLTTIRNSWQIGDAQVRVQSEVRRGLYSMVKRLRQTTAVMVTGVPADGNEYSSIIFYIPNGVNGDTINWVGPIQYSLDTSDINNDGVTDQLIRISASEVEILANNISILGFRRDSSMPNLLWVEVGSQVQTPAGHITSIVSETAVLLRN